MQYSYFKYYLWEQLKEKLKKLKQSSINCRKLSTSIGKATKGSIKTRFLEFQKLATPTT